MRYISSGLMGDLGLTERSRVRDRLALRGRRCLALGQAVDAVVHDDGANVEVPARLGRNVLLTDAEEVAIACDDDDVELGRGHLDAQRNRECAAVNAVEAERLVSLEEVDEVPRTSNTGHDHIVGHGAFGHRVPVAHGELERAPHAEIAATGAPTEIVLGVLVAHALTAGARSPALAIRSSMRSLNCLALNGRPVYCVIASAFTPILRSTIAIWPW